jgi:hypothetical protein
MQAEMIMNLEGPDEIGFWISDCQRDSNSCTVLTAEGRFTGVSTA